MSGRVVVKNEFEVFIDKISSTRSIKPRIALSTKIEMLKKFGCFTISYIHFLAEQRSELDRFRDKVYNLCVKLLEVVLAKPFLHLVFVVMK